MIALPAPTIRIPPGLTPFFRLALGRGGSLDVAPHRPRIMGVVNLTADSFSDGGEFLDPSRALAHARRLIAEGADILDLGAESTRPGGATYGDGAVEVPAEEEIARLRPLIAAIRRESAIPISVDTRKATVARAAFAAGADILNDVSALADPETAAFAAESDCPVVLMHHRGIFRPASSGVSQLPESSRVVDAVRAGLDSALARATAAGCRREQLVLDPGLGFALRGTQNLELLRDLHELLAFDRPLLVGASRKRFLGDISNIEQASERVPESLAAAAAAATQGASFLRVHDVAATKRFLVAFAAMTPGAAAPLPSTPDAGKAAAAGVAGAD
ncbi:MAG: dihydropteroate synthase [Thermoanaerobaculia bacterium]